MIPPNCMTFGGSRKSILLNPIPKIKSAGNVPKKNADITIEPYPMFPVASAKLKAGYKTAQGSKPVTIPKVKDVMASFSPFLMETNRGDTK